MKYMKILASTLLLTLTGCGIDTLDLDGSQKAKFWDVTDMNQAASKAAYQEWCVKEGIDSDVAVFFMKNDINNPQLVKQWGALFYDEQIRDNNDNNKKIDYYNNTNKNKIIAEIVTARGEDIAYFIRKGVTIQQYKEIVPVLNKVANQSNQINSRGNVVAVLEYMNRNHVSAQDAFDKLYAEGGIYKHVEIAPQRAEEIRHILQNSSYNTQQLLRPYVDSSIEEVSSYMDQYNLSAQDAIHKIQAESEQRGIQSRVKYWGSAVAKKCHNKIYDLEDTWTSEKGFEDGTCYEVKARIFQRISSNRILSKIIVYSDYKFKLIYLVSSKLISNGEILLVVPTKDFKYHNLLGDNKEINGFRVIQQQ